MAKTQSLPPDVLDLIFQNLIESPATLKICAVVCKLWLRPSRHHLESIKDLSIAPTEPGRASEERAQVLQELLLGSKPECSFWPHITKLLIPGYAKRSTENCIQLVFKALSLASNLRTLQLYGIEFPAVLEDAFPKNNSISSLLLKDTKFTSPAQLLGLLASLQNLHSDLSLENIILSNKDWDLEESDFVLHPALRVRLEPKESLKDILPVVLGCKLNVTFLKMDNAKSVGIDLYNQLLQHIGPSLEEIHIEFEDPREAFLEEEGQDSEDGDDEDEESGGDREDERDEEHERDDEDKNKSTKEDKEDEKESRKKEIVISLEHNTSLREIWIEDMITVSTSTSERRPSGYTQLASTLATIASGGKFQRLNCSVDHDAEEEERYELMDYDEDDDNEEKYGLIKSFNWKALDDVLGDKERFPGNGPAFRIDLGDDLNNETVVDVLLPRCMPKLVERGNLCFE